MMEALTVRPRLANSLALSELPEPSAEPGGLLVEAVLLGICGTDREIVSGQYGEAPNGKERLVLGHESLGRVRSAPKGSSFCEGQWVVGIVRHPDPLPCRCCAAGEWDMCENGSYSEHGIKRLDGFGSARYVLDPGFAVAVPDALGLHGVLVEPASVVAKAWEQVERLTQRSAFRPERVLVTGAGPIGLLSALMATQRGYKVSVLDRVREGIKPELVRKLGATYVCDATGALTASFDIVMECTGAPTLVVDALSCTGPNGLVCLAGISSGTRSVTLKASALNDELVMENGLVFGSVNANCRHYAAAVEALLQAPPDWLDRLITRRVPLNRFPMAFESRADDIKTVVDFR